MDKLINNAILDQATLKNVSYLIGIDTYEEDALCYCLYRKIDNNVEVILSKTLRNKNEFLQEVENIAKYFNAHIDTQFYSN